MWTSTLKWFTAPICRFYSERQRPYTGKEAKRFFCRCGEILNKNKGDHMPFLSLPYLEDAERNHPDMGVGF